jgi:hypothetical protein
MRFAKLGLVGAAMVATLFTLHRAQAQPAPSAPPPGPGYGYGPPPPPQGRLVRRGLVLGVGVGGGNYRITCGLVCDSFLKDRYSGPSFSLFVGGMIGDDVALMFDAWGVSSSINDHESLFHNMGTIALRYFPTSKLWLQGGLGWSNFSIGCDSQSTSQDCGETSKTGGAVMVAAGLELLQGVHWTVDVSVRAGGGAYDNGHVDMGAIQVGLNWY